MLILLLLAPAAPRAGTSSLVASFAACVGRFSAELEHTWLVNDGRTEDIAHRRRQFPKTRLHRVRGVKQAIYRADITKISGWRIHVQYIDGKIVLKDVIEGNRHDDVIKVIRTKKGRYK